MKRCKVVISHFTQSQMENRLCNDMQAEDSNNRKIHQFCAQAKSERTNEKNAILDYVEHDYSIHCISLIL